MNDDEKNPFSFSAHFFPYSSFFSNRNLDQLRVIPISETQKKSASHNNEVIKFSKIKFSFDGQSKGYAAYF